MSLFTGLVQKVLYFYRKKFQYNNAKQNIISMNILSGTVLKERKNGQNYSTNINKGEACPELDLSGLKLNEKLRNIILLRYYQDKYQIQYLH